MGNPNRPDFDQAIAEIEQKIAELENDAAAAAEALTPDLERLHTKLEQLLKLRHSTLSPWDRVKLARHPDRPQTSDYLTMIFEDFVELHGDRNHGDDRAIVGGFATIDDVKIVLVGHRKGKSTRERMACNFGMPHPEGYRKALRIMETAEKFNLPIVTLINTPGAYPGVGAEERGQSEAIAVNLQRMSRLAVPIVCTVIGEGGSGGALGIGVGDVVLVLENAYYSVISPEGCAAILWKDAGKAEEAADVLKITAHDLARFGIADQIVPEPLGGAHRDPAGTGRTLKEVLLKHLRRLRRFSGETLVERRYDKLRRIGQLLHEAPAP